MIVLPSAPGTTLFPPVPEDPGANFVLDRLPDHLGEETGGTFRLTVGMHFDYGPLDCKCPTCDAWRRDPENRRKAERRKTELDADLKEGVLTKQEHATKVALLKHCPNHKYLAYDEAALGGPEVGGYMGLCRVNKMKPIPRDQYKTDIITSHLDLNRRHPGKFVRLDANGTAAGTYAPPPAPFPLEKMGVAELLAVAAEEEIDVSKVKKDGKGALDKADLLATIQAAKSA